MALHEVSQVLHSDARVVGGSRSKVFRFPPAPLDAQPTASAVLRKEQGPAKKHENEPFS